jgi:hypothetical protein
MIGWGGKGARKKRKNLQKTKYFPIKKHLSSNFLWRFMGGKVLKVVRFWYVFGTFSRLRNLLYPELPEKVYR